MTTDPLPPAMDLAEAIEFSRFAARLLAAHPELASTETALDRPFEWTDLGLADAADAAALNIALRRLRQRVLLRTLLRDLTGRAELQEVCGTVTRQIGR